MSGLGQRLHHGEPVDVGKLDIEENDVRSQAPHFRNGLDTARGLSDPEARTLKHSPRKPAKARIVVDHQDQSGTHVRIVAWRHSDCDQAYPHSTSGHACTPIAGPPRRHRRVRLLVSPANGNSEHTTPPNHNTTSRRRTPVPPAHPHEVDLPLLGGTGHSRSRIRSRPLAPNQYESADPDLLGDMCTRTYAGVNTNNPTRPQLTPPNRRQPTTTLTHPEENRRAHETKRWRGASAAVGHSPARCGDEARGGQMHDHNFHAMRVLTAERIEHREHQASTERLARHIRGRRRRNLFHAGWSALGAHFRHQQLPEVARPEW